jgi:hypothetical protein
MAKYKRTRISESITIDASSSGRNPNKRRIALIKNIEKATLTKANLKFFTRYHEKEETMTNKPDKPAMIILKNNESSSTLFSPAGNQREYTKNFVS